MKTGDPLLTLKPQLLDMTKEEIIFYIKKLQVNRFKGPKAVKRSKETGKPSAGRAASPADKLDKLMAGMTPEERAEFITAAKGEEK